MKVNALAFESDEKNTDRVNAATVPTINRTQVDNAQNDNSQQSKGGTGNFIGSLSSHRNTHNYISNMNPKNAVANTDLPNTAMAPMVNRTHGINNTVTESNGVDSQSASTVNVQSLESMFAKKKYIIGAVVLLMAIGGGTLMSLLCQPRIAKYLWRKLQPHFDDVGFLEKIASQFERKL